MKSILLSTSILLLLFTVFSSCQPQYINPSQINTTLIAHGCTDRYEGSNNLLETTPLMEDMGTQWASLFAKDKDYWRISVKTGSLVKRPMYLFVQFEGMGTVKLTVSTNQKKGIIRTFDAEDRGENRIPLGNLSNNETVILLFEQLEGKEVCYGFGFDASMMHNL